MAISREHWDQDRVLRDAVLYRLDIMRAEFPELAKTYEPETTVEPGPDDTAACQAACWRTEGDSLRQS
jgi:hypothetical protein